MWYLTGGSQEVSSGRDSTTQGQARGSCLIQSTSREARGFRIGRPQEQQLKQPADEPTALYDASSEAASFQRVVGGANLSYIHTVPSKPMHFDVLVVGEVLVLLIHHNHCFTRRERIPVRCIMSISALVTYMCVTILKIFKAGVIASRARATVSAVSDARRQR